jgi:glucose-1-phosphatase
MISAVIFDMNDVLVRYDRSARIAYLARIAALAPATVEAAIWESGFEDEGDSGALDADSYLRGFGERLRYPLTEAEWTAALKGAVLPIAEALTLAAAVRSRARVAVLTNNNLLVKRMANSLYPELEAIFGQSFFVSAEFGVRKPDPDAYLRCLDRLGAPPHETVFVDDATKNVVGAERAGLHAHLCRTAGELERAFAAEGLL